MHTLMQLGDRYIEMYIFIYRSKYIKAFIISYIRFSFFPNSRKPMTEFHIRILNHAIPSILPLRIEFSVEQKLPFDFDC